MVSEAAGAASRRWFIVTLVAVRGLARAAAPLSVRLEGEWLRLSARGFRFMHPKALDRLRDGAPVTVDLLATLLADGRSTVVRRAAGRFVWSYDLWEEKFAVVRTLPEKRTVSRLSAEAAEAWCVENLPVHVAGLAPERDFWVRVEARVEERKETPPLVGSSGISLGALIEIFSRTSGVQPTRPTLEAGPFRLANLRR